MKHFKNIKNLRKYYGVGLKHPLVDILKYEEVNNDKIIKNEELSFDFYTISFVKNFNGYIQIGNTRFEGNNGILHFIEPKQLYTCNATNPWKGYQILIHPNIFKKQFSHKKIDTYDFFSYQVNESLLLNEQEKASVESILHLAWLEFNKQSDDFSIPIILSYISTLLNLSERFYARQFTSRKKVNNELYLDFLVLLKKHYLENNSIDNQQPTVQYFASKLNVTPNYLSDAIKHHTGSSALTIIHDFIIDEAKNQLKNSNKTVAEIAFSLGYEYPNYFSKLFRKSTNLSPTEYKKSVKSI